MALTDMVDIVDEDDNVIGNASIKEVREKGLIHRISRVVIVDPAHQKMLIQKRSKDKPLWPGCWDFAAAGHVDSGEDYETAAKRELEEELGISGVVLKEQEKHRINMQYENIALRRFQKTYEAVYDATPQHLQHSEVEEVKLISPGELREMIRENGDSFTRGLREVMQRFYS